MGAPLKLLLVAALIGGAGYAAYRYGLVETAPVVTASHAPERSRALELADVEISRVERQTIADDLRISGSLRPATRAIINAPLTGTIATIHADVGDSVSAGDVLVEFDTELLTAVLAARQATLEATQAQLDLARSTLERSRRLGQTGIAAQSAVLEAEASVLNLEAQLRALEADLSQARRQLADARVLAPFDGVVSSREVEAGQAVGANSAMLAMVDLTRMEMEATVPTVRIADVETGQTASLSVDGFANRTFEGRIARISPTAVSGSRAVRVFVEVENENALLRGGMFATGTLQLRSAPDVIALPNGAFRSDEHGAFVLKAEDGRLKRQGVETGSVWPGQGLTEVVEGLREGDLVVTAPLPDLVPDVEFRIAEI